MIIVMTEISRDDFKKADRYVLQEGGYLAIMAKLERVALYAPGKWIFAADVADDGVTMNHVV